MTAQKIFSSYKTLIGFMILCVFVQMILGDQVLTAFLWLVLFSMIIINSGDFIAFLQGLK